MPEENIPITEDEISNYLEYAEQWYAQQNPQATDEELDQYSEFIKSAGPDQLKLVKMYQLSDLIIKALSLNEFNIDLVLASRLSQQSRASLTAARDNSQLIGVQSGVQKSMLRVTPTDIKTTYDSFLSLLNSNIDAYRFEIAPDTSSVEQVELIEELAEDAENQIEERKELVRENVEKSESAEKKPKKKKKIDFSKMTPEEIEEYATQRARSFEDSLESSKQKSKSKLKLKKKDGEMSPEELYEYLLAKFNEYGETSESEESKQNSYVEENGDKKNTC